MSLHLAVFATAATTHYESNVYVPRGQIDWTSHVLLRERTIAVCGILSLV